MKEEKKEDKSWFRSPASREKLPAITEEMVIQNKEAIKKRKQGSEGKLFWEKKK